MIPNFVVLLARTIGVGNDVAGWPVAGVCSAKDPTAKVTKGPALSSAGRDGIILARISPEVGLLVELASSLLPLLERVELKPASETVMVGMVEASGAPANTAAEVAELPEFSVVVIA